jgi:hypothetical protein
MYESLTQGPVSASTQSSDLDTIHIHNALDVLTAWPAAVWSEAQGLANQTLSLP